MDIAQDFFGLPTVDKLQPKMLSLFSQKPVIKSTFLLNYGMLRDNSIVDIETVRDNDTKATGTTTVQKGMPFHQIIKRTLLVHVSALLWMVIGILAFLDLNGTGIHSCSKQSRKNPQQSPSPLKLPCAFFSGFGALYLASVAPIASRIRIERIRGRIRRISNKKYQISQIRGHTLISDLIFSNRLFISSSPDIFDFIIVTRRLMEE